MTENIAPQKLGRGRGRPRNVIPKVPRSFRLEEPVWTAARARAKREGTTLNRVVSDLVEGYARGIYELPEHRLLRKFPTDS